jgi:hypothetical protein
MTTPRQHAKRGLKALRTLIATLQEANADGVNLAFQQEAQSTGADDYVLGSLGAFYTIDPASLGVRAAQTSYVVVAASETDDEAEEAAASA